MSNKRQTAVEWLVEQIIKEKGLVDLDIQSAKEMEKEQIVEAWCNGFDEEDRATSNPLKYYDKTFNTEQP